MPTSEELTDSYLEALLNKEASEFASGIRKGQTRPREAPKPNLRFLRNIIKDTDSHNAVLIEREKRLAAKGAKQAYEAKRSDADSERASKRQRIEKSDRWASALGHAGLRRNDDKSRRERHKPERSSENQRTSHHRRRQSQDRYRSRSPAVNARRHRRHRSRSASPSREAEASIARQANEHDSDSDPLDAIVGPRPPPRSKPRGRGAAAESSGIDSRFRDPTYDPSRDTQQDEDDNDWDMALSALQDRKKWRAIGADRLRAAGFSEVEVNKWEADTYAVPKSADQDIDNVVWRKRGEARDWDRGKALTADGDVINKAPWKEPD